MKNPKSYRKKPVVIEAMQVTHEYANNLAQWLPSETTMVVLSPDRISVHIRTLEGEMIAHEGDWIICGVRGEFYPCKADIFEATYEEVK